MLLVWEVKTGMLPVWASKAHTSGMLLVWGSETHNMWAFGTLLVWKSANGSVSPLLGLLQGFLPRWPGPRAREQVRCSEASSWMACTCWEGLEQSPHSLMAYMVHT